MTGEDLIASAKEAVERGANFALVTVGRVYIVISLGPWTKDMITEINNNIDEETCHLMIITNKNGWQIPQEFRRNPKVYKEELYFDDLEDRTSFNSFNIIAERAFRADFLS